MTKNQAKKKLEKASILIGQVSNALGISNDELNKKLQQAFNGIMDADTVLNKMLAKPTSR